MARKVLLHTEIERILIEYARKEAPKPRYQGSRFFGGKTPKRKKS